MVERQMELQPMDQDGNRDREGAKGKFKTFFDARRTDQGHIARVSVKSVTVLFLFLIKSFSTDNPLQT